MRKKKNRSGGRNAVVVLMLFGVLGVSAVAFYVSTTPEARRVPDFLRSHPAEEQPQPRLTRSGSEDVPSQPATETQPKKVFIPEIVGDSVQVTKSAIVPNGQDPMVFVAGQTLTAVGSHDVQALGVQVKDRVAYIEFTPAIEDGMGSMQEGAFIKALQTAFAQFDGVDKVELMSEGKPIESLGHFELTGSLDVIRPGQEPPKPSEASKQP